MRLIVQTAEKVLLDETGLGRIRLPMGDGSSIGVRSGHHKLIAEAGRGRLLFGVEEFEKEAAVDGGIVYVENDTVTIFTSGWLDPGKSHRAPGELVRLTGLLKSYGKEG